MAGPEWASLLEPAGGENSKEVPRHVVRVYRGQTILEEASREAPAEAQNVLRTELLAPNVAASEKPVRLYRGQPIL